MATFVAHYSSAKFSEARSKGSFDFESECRMGSKGNMHDARVRMLELYGNEALSWTIDKVEHRSRSKSNTASDGQLELDFREPVKPTKKRRNSTKRGMI